MRNLIVYSFTSTLFTLIVACGGGAGGGVATTPALALRAQAPAYDLIAEVTVGRPNSTVAFRRLDGSVIATHSVCPAVVGARGIAVTSDGYVRIRCSRDTATNSSTVFEFDPANWSAAPQAVSDDLVAPQALGAIISFGPNGEEFYNKTVFEPGTGKPIETLFRIAGNVGQRVASDILVLPNNMLAMKIIYASDKAKAYILASDGSANNSIFEIDLTTFATALIRSESYLIHDIALNGTELVYTRQQLSSSQPLDDMVVISLSSRQIVRTFDFTCPNDSSAPAGGVDFGGRIVLTPDSLVVGSALCHQVFTRSNYAVSKWNYPIVNSSFVNQIPQVFAGNLLWATYQLGSLQSYITAHDIAIWLADETPRVFVPGTLGDLVHIVH
jgi:hypothetical protein